MKNLKENRCFSFIAIAVIYVICSAIGIYIYNHLSYDWWLNLLIADVGATAACFIFSVIFRNASVYDPYWSVQPIVIMVYAVLTNPVNLTGILFLIAISWWGLRLTANWAYTFGNLTCQDWRYTMLHDTTGIFYPVINFVGIHLVPTLVVYGCVLPAVTAVKMNAAFNWMCVPFICVSIGAAALQLVSDYQMHSYRKNRNGPFILNGLWKYSRHPNYLGEILMWWGIALAALCVMPDKIVLLSGAVLNTLLFNFISIPLAENRQGKKEGFAEYKAKTHRLFILPVKK